MVQIMASNRPTYDFNVYKGADRRHTFTYTDDAGTPIDLTTYTAEFNCAPTGKYAPPILTKTLTKDDLAGRVFLTITAAETQAFKVDSLLYSILLKKAGETLLLVNGVITVKDTLAV